MSSFHLTVLGSGSAGNCALVETADGTRLLIDAGMSARQVVTRLGTLGLQPEQLHGILITHEHGDHAGALEILCRRCPELPIYATRLCGEALRAESRGPGLRTHRAWRLFQPGRSFHVGGLAVESFPVPHDAADPVGFTFRCGDAVLAVLSDLGHATKLALEHARAATTLFIEANHDGPLLQQDTKRPWSVKQRILSRHGHLSNDAAARAVADLLSAGAPLNRVVLGHLSRDCNQPDLASGAVRALTPGAALEILCAAQAEIGPRLGITAPPVLAAGPTAAESRWTPQLELF